jgi:hypothetical protein
MGCLWYEQWTWSLNEKQDGMFDVTICSELSKIPHAGEQLSDCGPEVHLLLPLGESII